MKRIHIHIKTKDLERSIDFYSAMFGEAPTKRESDYAKWMLEDPRANISLSTNSGQTGVDHAGISIDTREELEEIAGRLGEKTALAAEDGTTCCYAKSNKYWARDPQGAIWELFQTYGEAERYGSGPDLEKAIAPQVSDCCDAAQRQ